MSEFDWVEARANCTVATVFKKLSEDVQNDLSRYEQLCPGQTQSRKFENCEKGFYVEFTHQHRVVFEHDDTEIKIGRWANVGGKHTPLTVLTVKLDDDGECILVDSDGDSWKPWQVRRKALEETLFG
ncbi:MAG: hypothetical protein F4239_05470 [Gammaproteobacteria bacterium]|nr:hypothetical protein [Gammaproteobacteria bacterium]